MMKGITIALVLVPPAALVLARQTSTAPSEVHRLYLEDQQDRGVGQGPGEPLPWVKIEPRDRSRRQRVHELLAING